MKTLFLAPQVPWPLDVGSKIRVHNLLRCYAEMGDVTLMCFAENESEAQAVRNLEQYCKRIFCLPLMSTQSVPGQQSGKFGALMQLIRLRPRVVQFFNCPKLASRVESLVASEHFDIVHVERLFMAINANAVLQGQSRSGRPLLVLDVDDLESKKIGRLAALRSWRSPQKYFDNLEFLKLKVFERRVLPRFDCVLVCSEKDRLQLARGHRLPWVEVFSNGAEVSDCVLPPGSRDDGRTLVFLGAMNYQPNEDAALYFAESILPLIRERLPGVRLVVAGKSPSPQLRALHNGRDLLVTGYVEDKNQLFTSCTAFVVPLRIGGGTRLKILEAMAFGKPVVSTTLGCEGINVTSGENILVADSPQDFAATCIDLLADETQRQALGRAGRELVERSYRWEAIRGGFVKTLQDRFLKARYSTPPQGQSTPETAVRERA